MRWRILSFGLIALLILGAWISFRARPRASASLLLITLDTTRADRLGAYGYAAARTPVLDALAQAGVRCERAYTVAPMTLPAHVSLMTGLHPAETGVRRNGRERLETDIPTLAEILRGKGYDTGAFVASFVLDSKFGLDRGFDHYDDHVGASSPAGNPEQLRRSGASVVDAALKWLGERTTRPVFCWVHFYDPHAPVVPHRELFGDEFADRPYDAEIAYVDNQVGRLLDALKIRRHGELPLIVVVGDHGEGLGEHFEQSHSLTLYNSIMRVPLIVSRPGQLPSGERISGNVSIVDLFPTILDLLGHSVPGRVSGASFLPALLGAGTAESVCCGATDDPFDVYGCAPLRSLTVENWKFIRSAQPELYDLAADPHELSNLVLSQPEKAREMESRLADFEAELAVRDVTRIRLSASERRTLESLGYTGVSTKGAPDPIGARLPDIKEILPLETDVEESVRLFGRGAQDEAIELLRKVVRKAPTHAPASWSLAWALWRQSKREEGMQVFRDQISVRPGCHTAHYGLGFMLLQQDQLDEAIPEFLKAIESDPEYVEAHFHLAEVLFATGRVEECLAHLSSVLEIDAGHAGAIQLRTFVQASQGRLDAASAEYRKALRRASDESRAADGGQRPQPGKRSGRP